jgi:hypothetical protein
MKTNLLILLLSFSFLALSNDDMEEKERFTIDNECIPFSELED